MIKTALSDYNKNRTDRAFMQNMYAEVFYPYDEYSNWCAIYMYHLAKAAMFETPPIPIVARSWLKVGNHIEKPKTGDLIILWRASIDSWKGHVGIFLRFYGKDRVYVLGGNQGPVKSVCIQPYPIKNLLGYRRLGIG